MMKRLILIILLSFLVSVPGTADTITADSTLLFAHRDTCDLFLDIYNPAEGSGTSIEGKEKPTILFMFGGGFISGRRDDKSYQKWFRLLNERGYKVVSIDYRLGLKGKKMKGLEMVKNLRAAIKMAVEDLYSAVNFIIDNSGELGIDPSNIVLSGSSAGAISVLQADLELCKKSEIAQVLPDDFHFAGVMSFSGAVFSDEGKPSYRHSEPAPTLFFHGTADRMVNYNRIWLFNHQFVGSNYLVPIFKNNGYNYNFFRFKDRGHEICNIMVDYLDEEERFIEANVMKGEKRIIDATVNDPSIATPGWAKNPARTIYE